MSSKARVLLVGSGGIGTVTALNLEQGGHAEVTVVCRSNYKAAKEKGFTIDSCDHGKFEGWKPSEILNKIPDVSADKSSKPFDYIIVTTKNIPDVPPTVVDLIKPAVTPEHSVIVLVQNGLNIEKPLHKAFPTNVVLSGVSLMGANEIAHGHIVEEDPDRLFISPFLGSAIDDEKEIAAAKEFVRIYQASGKVQCSYEADVLFVRWRKLMYNAVWNPICALTDMDTTRLRLMASEDDPASPVNLLVRPAMNEVRAAAKAAANVDLPESLVEDMVEADPMEIWCCPSMLQDKRKKRYIEYQNIVGEALRDGEKAGVAMPTVRTIFGLCKAVQWRTMDHHGLVDPEKMLKEKTKA
ncbi:2-dehydropantoate 2-reductase [Exophiala viscosa]|uniref:2-dehydropantoate 2-reductase n=1 Tax=Exophiala viscosa TaxID=2486360 RepID=A0AAN6DVY2_9EURO|nr:2-dehydropantoate 2-reductase [Exophiala viscosa]KAI1626178.1 2-dehydropantoate 2-reductase [Exophiala viscosa]